MEGDVISVGKVASDVWPVTPQAGTHYEGAPIVEAIAEFSVEPLVDPQKLKMVSAKLATTYPNVAPLADRPVSRSFSSATGFGLISADEQKVVQVRTDGFAFSWRKPYDRWEPFIEAAREAWNVYATEGGEVSVTSFSVRYINEMVIPLLVPLHRYFNTYVAQPNRDQLFQYMFFMTKTEIERPAGELSVAMFPVRTEDDDQKVVMTLDNTFTFRVRSDTVIWQMADEIRALKNRVFESQITDEMRAIIQA